MSCTPPTTPERDTFTVSLDGTRVKVTPSSHGTQHQEKQFHLVITDGSAVFDEHPVCFLNGQSPDTVFSVQKQSPCYVTIQDVPLPDKKLSYGFTIRVKKPGTDEVFHSSDPTIVNDPEPPPS